MQMMTKPFPNRKASNNLSQLHNQRRPVTWEASVLLWHIWKQWSLAAQSVLWEREYQRKRQRRWHLTADPGGQPTQDAGPVILVAQLLSPVWLFMTPRTAAHQASLSFTISWSLLKSTPIELVILSDHLIPCCPLLFLPSVFPASGSFPMSQLSPWTF